jgi:hypothetical protein
VKTYDIHNRDDTRLVILSLYISQAPFCHYSLMARKAKNPFPKTDKMFFKKNGGLFRLSRKLHESV